MDVGHIGSSLSQIWSFSHTRCDEILQNRNIEIGAFNPRKSGLSRDGVYFGFFWIIGWLVLCSGMLVRSWLSQDPETKQGKRVLPFFLLFGFAGLYFQLQDMAQYVDVCRGVLKLSQAVAPYRETPNLWVMLFALTAFAGMWYTKLIRDFREATSFGDRVLPAVLMIFGGVFLAFIGGAFILNR